MTVAIPMMPAPKERALVALASIVGGSLPKSYLDFVERHDGAVPASNCFAVGAGNETGVRRFIAIADAPSVLREVDGFPAGMIPLAEDDCGNFIYMDAGNGKVFFWDHEVDGPDQELAADLPTFLHQMTAFDPSSAKAVTGRVLRVWVDPTFKPEF